MSIFLEEEKEYYRGVRRPCRLDSSWPGDSRGVFANAQQIARMTLSLAFKDLALYGLTLALAFLFVLPFRRRTLTSDPNKLDHDALVGDKRDNNSTSRDDIVTNTATSRTTTNTIMQAPREDLPPPKDDPFTLEELKAFDGSDASKPVYVAIKGTSSSSYLPLSSYPHSHVPDRPGTVFDVSRKRDTYGPGGSYAVFAGKDGSRGLGLSSLKPEDAVPDWSTLEEKDRKTLDDWHAFFTCVSFLSPASAFSL